MNGARRSIADFAGAVSVRGAPSGALRLELEGRDPQGRRTSVAFASPGFTPQIPRELHDVQVVLDATATSGGDANTGPADGQCAEIAAREGRYTIVIAGVHVHRDLTDELRRVVAPRAAPWRKRLLWRVALALAASSAGRRLLLAVRRR
jgi:hypothetical protein